jgi:protoporphyrin/coproporphyrin ferrochelatase
LNVTPYPYICSMATQSELGIVLMNLGSPDSPSVPDVRRYLAEFLMDEKVIDYPFLPRLMLVRGIIVPFRAPKSAEAYHSVWTKNGAPLIENTKQLQLALAAATNLPVVIAMRYGNPTPKHAFDQLAKEYPHVKKVVLVSLYPHFAASSYETAVLYAEQAYKKGKYPFEMVTVPPFYKEPEYITALAASMQPYLQQEYDHILFSYHGLPERHIFKGDVTKAHCLKVADCCNVASEAHKFCYRHQCYVTTRLVTEQLHIPEQKYSQSFQSRLGRTKWLEPYTVLRLQQLPKQGVKKLLVVCPAFVSDCLETLEEIEIAGKETFLEAGGEEFKLIPCLNAQEQWVQVLKAWAEKYK